MGGVGQGRREGAGQSEGVGQEPKGAETGAGQQGMEERRGGCQDTCGEVRRGEGAEGEGGEDGGKATSREAGGKEASRVVGHDDPGTKERREDRRKLQSARPGVHARNIRTASVWLVNTHTNTHTYHDPTHTHTVSGPAPAPT